jgi:phosphatidylserine decarboxylase
MKLRGSPRAPKAARIGTRSDRRRVIPQYLMPKRRLTAFAGRVASKETGRTRLVTMRWFVRKYGVDLSEAAEPELARYASFNAFFTRALKPGARPIADADLVSPVDGTISQFGAIERDQILQAKGHRYSTAALVGGDTALAARFHDGHFATLYLSPRDYHRIHMPCAGRLVRMIHVPGDLFSVNPATARGVPGLFARNERTVCLFERCEPSGEVGGPFAIVLVGATIVGSMETVWHGAINATRTKRVREWLYDADDIALAKGDEMGRFLLGSTVVLLFPSGPLAFDPSWEPGKAIRLGEAMARRGDARLQESPTALP